MTDEEEYIASLTPQERTVLEIAKHHLGSSFDLSKSIGYVEWERRRKNENTQAQESD